MRPCLQVTCPMTPPPQVRYFAQGQVNGAGLEPQRIPATPTPYPALGTGERAHECRRRDFPAFQIQPRLLSCAFTRASALLLALPCSSLPPPATSPLPSPALRHPHASPATTRAPVGTLVSVRDSPCSSRPVSHLSP